MALRFQAPAGAAAPSGARLVARHAELQRVLDQWAGVLAAAADRGDPIRPAKTLLRVLIREHRDLASQAGRLAAQVQPARPPSERRAAGGASLVAGGVSASGSSGTSQPPSMSPQVTPLWYAARLAICRPVARLVRGKIPASSHSRGTKIR